MDYKKNCLDICIVMFISGVSSFVVSIMMMVYLLYTRGRKELEEHYLIGQLVLANLLTSLSIIVYPITNFILKKDLDCQIASLLTFCLIILTFGLKLTIYCARHRAMKNHLARTNQNMTGIYIRLVKVVNIIIWLIPTGIFAAGSIYFQHEMAVEFIYRPINCNYTVHEDICYVSLAQDTLLFAIYFLVIIIITILGYQVIQMYHQAHRNRGVIGFQQIRLELLLRNKLLWEIFLFTIWWAPCSILRIYYTVSYAINQEPKEKVVLVPLYMQAFLSPSQGVIDFVLFLFGYPQITTQPNLSLNESTTTTTTTTTTSQQNSSQPLLPESSAIPIRGDRAYSLSLENEYVLANRTFSLP